MGVDEVDQFSCVDHNSFIDSVAAPCWMMTIEISRKQQWCWLRQIFAVLLDHGVDCIECRLRTLCSIQIVEV